MIVRAYDVASGDVEWDFSRPNVSPVELELDSGRLFVAGAIGRSTYLAAFAARTGASLWEDTAPLSGTLRDIAVRGPRLAAAFQQGTRYAVRAYDAGTGAVQWQDSSAAPAGVSELALAVDLNDAAIYVGGRAAQSFTASELMVRAYESQTGALLWDDRSHESDDSGGNTFVDLRLGKHRLFVAGFAFQDAVNADFVIRAYDIRGDVAGP
jgi:outer membrane protein assembly factor BamB